MRRRQAIKMVKNDGENTNVKYILLLLPQSSDKSGYFAITFFRQNPSS
jgi:hypothetical protein